MAAKILKLPDYCNLSKDLLVEELDLAPTLEFHFGKCIVIGRVRERNELWYLQNIYLRNVDEEYRLDEGAVEILLLPTSYHKNKDDNVYYQTSLQDLSDGSYCEIHGEAIFRNSRDLVQFDDNATVTVSELIHQLRVKHLTFIESADILTAKEIQADPSQLDNDAIRESIEQFKQTHIRAIKVHTMRKIKNVEDAEDLVQTNMERRLMRAQRR